MPNRPLRLRVFAGPNGSGKSTIINAVRNLVIEGKPIDFGYYVNADDIAAALRKGSFSFQPFDFQLNEADFIHFALNSGLLHKTVSSSEFSASFRIRKQSITVIDKDKFEQLAQLVARFL